MKNPLTALVSLFSGAASDTGADTLQKIDERDILKGLTIDMVDAFAERYKFAGRIVDGGFELEIVKRIQ